MKKYLQYGCGITAPKEWINFDASPTILVERIPVLGKIIKGGKRLFPENVRFGNIIKGLSDIGQNSCDGVFCSHVLEHLSYEQCRIALAESYKILRPGGFFRCIVPDLEQAAREYITTIENGKACGNSELLCTASFSFMQATSLGVKCLPKNIFEKLRYMLGHSEHLWMWDEFSLRKELEIAGFKNIRKAEFNDSSDPMFALVEDAERFKKSVAFESMK